MSIEINKLQLGYQDKIIVRDLSLSFPSNQIIALIGPNGCGKSTTLKAVARLLKPRLGTITHKGKDIWQSTPKEYAKQLAFLPQQHLVPEGIKVRELIAYGRSPYLNLWGNWANPYIWILLGVLLATGALGFYDDWRKVVYKDPNGVSAKFKMVWQSSVAIIAGLALFYLATNSANNILIVPFFKQVALPLGVIGFLVLSYLTIVGTSNAVNLTDGLDGLAAFPVVLVAAGLAIFAYASGHSQFAQYLQLPYVAGANEVVIFCTAMCGACLGFLWFNAYPAQVFMGDVGALALGAALGTVAVIIRQEFVLVIMGGLFVVEAISVMLQVGWYKRTKKRIFLMAPIHHHYEQKGWKETQVVVRFWIITIVLVLIGLSTLKIR